jgi:hypothetical protein
MIYEIPAASSPISQGDIFFNIPIVDLPADEISIIEEDESARVMPWLEFASNGQRVSALVTIRPTIAIVGTQECDALRAPNITLFEVRSFRDVERKSKDTHKPSKWVPIITQHARINQKWFYLPMDDAIGFSEKMGADFLTPIRIPRVALEQLIDFRRGRLNEIAKQHFRERVAEFFRRYAYDEWYSLNPDEFDEYKKNYPEAEPFSWQGEHDPSIEHEFITAVTPDIQSEDGALVKGYFDYQVGMMSDFGELNELLEIINKENDLVTDRVSKHNEKKNSILSDNDPNLDKMTALNNLYMKAAGDIQVYSNRIERVNQRFEKAVDSLTENVAGIIEWSSSNQSDSPEEIRSFKQKIESMSEGAIAAKKSFGSFRDTAIELSNQKINAAMTLATKRQSKALDGVVMNVERVESFCLQMLFLITERFGDF